MAHRHSAGCRVRLRALFATACAMDLLLDATRKAATTCVTPELDVREGGEAVIAEYVATVVTQCDRCCSKAFLSQLPSVNVSFAYF